MIKCQPIKIEMMKNVTKLLTLLLTFTAYLGIAQPDYVGNRFPDVGTINEGESFTIYVQVYEPGITEPAGQGAGIDCEIYYGEVSMVGVGDTWTNITSVPMTYNVDIGNNDEYVGTLDLPEGFYEYKCRCTTDGGVLWTFDDETNGLLTVEAPLPVQLSIFEAYIDAYEVDLLWETESEIHNSHFILERSSDLRNWKTLAKVNGQGTSVSHQEYGFTDIEPMSGINYYRLQQVDYNGTYSYSEVVHARLEKETITFYPNPVYDQLFLGSSPKKTYEKVEILAADGQVVYLKKNPGNMIQLQDLVSGYYMIRVTDKKGEQFISSFIKE